VKPEASGKDRGKRVRIQDISKLGVQLIELNPKAMAPLIEPYDRYDEPPLKQLNDAQKAKLEHSLDGHTALALPIPQNEAEERAYVDKFLIGLQKLFSAENNWTFLQPLLLTLENCTRCQTCSDACPVFESSGGQEIYRPTYRAEVVRRIIKRYLKPGGKFFSRFSGANVDLNYQTVARLAELSYRCTLCRRCAQACPIGIDEPLGRRSERDRFGSLDAGGGFRLALCLDRVSAIAPDLAGCSRFLARLFKAYVAQ
jgi:ferredoxin